MVWTTTAMNLNFFYKENGITGHRIVRHTLQQNGLAERMNRIFIKKVRCMLFNANIKIILD